VEAEAEVEEEGERKEKEEDEEPGEEGEEAMGGDNDFGDDDFDDFGEVVEGEEFDNFQGFGESQAFGPPPVEEVSPRGPLIPVQVLDFEELGCEDNVRQAVVDSIAKIFSTDKTQYQDITPISLDDSSFLTERRFVCLTGPLFLYAC
jgi:hypothetical protein